MLDLKGRYFKGILFFVGRLLTDFDKLKKINVLKISEDKERIIYFVKEENIQRIVQNKKVSNTQISTKIYSFAGGSH